LVTSTAVPTLESSDGHSNVGGSIIAGPAGTPRCVDDDLQSEGWNVITDDSCAFDEATDQPSTDPELRSLGDHRGPTVTYLIAPTSTAIDAITLGASTLCDATYPVDQRGLSRPAGAGCDVGAVERQASD
jgi:hypothetical protein